MTINPSFEGVGVVGLLFHSADELAGRRAADATVGVLGVTGPPPPGGRVVEARNEDVRGATTGAAAEEERGSRMISSLGVSAFWEVW